MKHFAKFIRVGIAAMMLAIGVFAIASEGARAQTCTGPAGDTGTCFDNTKQTCSGTPSTAATGCSGSLTCCYGTVSNASSSTCNASYCKSQCDSTTDDTSQGAACDTFCSEKYPNDKIKYCPPKGSTTTGSTTTTGSGASVSMDLPNPLKYGTVQQVLMALLYALQGVIVVLSLVFIVIAAILYITSTGNQARVTAAKTAMFAALIGLAIGILAPTFLKEIATVLGWNSTAPLPPEVSSAKSAADILLSVLNFLLGIVGILAIIMLVAGGIMFLGAAGDMNRVGTAKKIVTFALIGIVVALASLVIVRQLAEFFAPATT